MYLLSGRVIVRVPELAVKYVCGVVAIGERAVVIKNCLESIGELLIGIVIDDKSERTLN